MPFNSEMLKVCGKNNDVFVGVFKPNGTNPIDQTQNTSGYGVNTGARFTVAYSATGIYTVTLEQEYGGIISAIPWGINLGAFEVDCITVPGALGGSGKTFQIRGKDMTGAAAAITAGASIFVGFAALLKSKGTVAQL